MPPTKKQMRKKDIKQYRKLARPAKAPTARQTARQFGGATQPRTRSGSWSGSHRPRRRHYDGGYNSGGRYYYDDWWFWAPYMWASGPYPPTLSGPVGPVGPVGPSETVTHKVIQQSPLETLTVGSLPIIAIGAVLLWLFARK